MTWMIYGATGYTGQWMAREAQKRGLKPILAGRNLSKVQKLADSLGLQARAFSLESKKEIETNISDCQAVLHCAGPFSKTHKAVFDACLKHKVHYLDITGEIPVFERLNRKKEEIAKAGIIAMAGVGFDIVPSDCLAALLKREMPDAIQLRLGFKLNSGASPGTLKTIIEGLPAGGVIRKNGQLKLVRAGYRVRKIPFGGKATFAVTVPWADVATSYYSTGIPNIEMYFAMPGPTILGLIAMNPIRPLLMMKPLQKFLQSIVEKKVLGDSDEAISQGYSLLWGEVTNAKGEKKTKSFQTGHPYELTVDAALHSVQKVLNGKVKAGFWTPSQAFGPDFLFELKGIQNFS